MRFGCLIEAALIQHIAETTNDIAEMPPAMTVIIPNGSVPATGIVLYEYDAGLADPSLDPNAPPPDETKRDQRRPHQPLRRWKRTHPGTECDETAWA